MLGNGDMLFLGPPKSDPHRIQGAFLDTHETERLIGWYRERAAARAEEESKQVSDELDILEEVRELELEDSQVDVSDEVMADWDPHFRKAAEIVHPQRGGVHEPAAAPPQDRVRPGGADHRPAP